MENVDFWALGIEPKTWTKQHTEKVQEFIRAANKKALIDYGFKQDTDEDSISMQKFGYMFQIYNENCDTIYFAKIIGHKDFFRPCKENLFTVFEKIEFIESLKQQP